jgi:cytochrome c peroxidase
MKLGLILSGILLLTSCSKDDNTEETYMPTPLALEVPELFEERILAPVIPFDNPQTVEGVALGKKLFFETLLSADNTQSCASCHAPSEAFSDSNRFSVGIDGLSGNRNSMPIFNLAFNYDEKFFWDGRVFSLEHQALQPVENPIEMHNTWQNVVDALQNTEAYPELFSRAFGTSEITSELVTKAIAQFERTLISGNSKFDKYLLGTTTITPEELNGLNIFMDETKGDCFHCHGNVNNPLWTDNMFHNNALDATFTDLGLGEVSGDPADNGKFKTPSLRNLAFTAPYMHDGRFNTLDEVINHYSEGLKSSSTVDPLMKKVDEGGVHLSTQEKADLKAFLLTLTDNEFITNPAFQN